MPLFHAAALYIFINSAIYWDSPVALGIPDRPLSSDLVIECIKYADVESAFLPPVILEEISHDPEQTKSMAKMNIVCFGGGK